MTLDRHCVCRYASFLFPVQRRRRYPPWGCGCRCGCQVLCRICALITGVNHVIPGYSIKYLCRVKLGNMNFCRHALLHRRLSGFLWMDCVECLGLVAVRVWGGGTWFYEGVKDSVGKDGVVVVKWFPAVCSLWILNLSIVLRCAAFFWWCNTCIMLSMGPKECALSWRFCAKLEVWLLW